MMQSQRFRIGGPREGEAVDGEASQLERFKSLARRPLNVSRKELDQEQKRFDTANAARREKKDRGA